MKKIVAILLVLCMAFALFACNKGDDKDTTAGTSSAPPAGTSSAPPAGTSSTPPSSGGVTTPSGGGTVIEDKPPEAPVVGRDTLDIQVIADIGSLSPAPLTGGLYNAAQMIFEPLWDVLEDGTVINVLAESIEDIGPTQQIIHLRKGVTFSNGNPMTAEDVIFSINVYKNIGVNAVRAQALDAEATSIIDDYTVDLRMLDYYLFAMSASSMLMIYDHQTYDEATIGTNPVGTGPYVLKEYVANSHCFLERREDYWGAKPEIQYLNFRVMSEPTQIVNGLDTKTLDVAQIELQDYDYVSSLPGFNINARDTGGGISLGIASGKNSAFSRYDDPDKGLEARKAVVHAINPQVIIDVVYYGHGSRVHCVSPYFCLDYEDAFNDMDPTYAIGYDLDLARQYAECTGLKGKTITVITNSIPQSMMIAEILQDMLKQIDVTVMINNYDQASYTTALYDPEATHDLSISPGIAPNRRVCDLLVNGVRYSPVLSAPGAFPNNEYYLELAPKTIHTADDAQRRAYLVETLTLYMENVLSYILCMNQTAMAISTDIDMSTVKFSICTPTIRYMDVKWAS
jgi:peptide/nickel transport system substrate-binding protein